MGTAIFCVKSFSRALQWGYRVMEKGISENVIFPLGAFCGHCIYHIDGTGAAQGDVLLWTSQPGAKAVFFTLAFSMCT